MRLSLFLFVLFTTLALAQFPGRFGGGRGKVRDRTGSPLAKVLQEKIMENVGSRFIMVG